MPSDPTTLPFTSFELSGISVLLSSPESENVRAGGGGNLRTYVFYILNILTGCQSPGSGRNLSKVTHSD